MNNDFITDLNTLFEKERDAIFDGSFKDLQVISTRKNQMIKQVPALQFSQEVIFDLMTKAKQNQDLLAAVVRGVRMVNNRINAVRHNSGGLESYDKSGNRVSLTETGQALEWRA